MELANKRALITGASQGLGRAIAHRLARAGMDVALHYNDSAEKAGQSAEQIKENPIGRNFSSAHLPAFPIGDDFGIEFISKLHNVGLCSSFKAKLGVFRFKGTDDHEYISRSIRLISRLLSGFSHPKIRWGWG